VATCFYCSTTLSPKREWQVSFPQRPHQPHDATKDHVYPRSLVEGLSPAQHSKLPAKFKPLNLVDSCRGCNDYKGRLHPLDWLVIMPNAPNAARLAERLIEMGEDMQEVFAALRRRRR
jgi:hypothetical protein